MMSPGLLLVFFLGYYEPAVSEPALPVSVPAPARNAASSSPAPEHDSAGRQPVRIRFPTDNRPLLIEQAPAGSSRFLAERAFRDALQRPLAVHWEFVPLRQALARLRELTQVAVVVDRRLDPDREVRLDVADEPLTRILDLLVADQQGVCRIVGNVVVLLPRDAGARLRTLAAARRNELQDAGSVDRRASLLQRKSLIWGDLSQPAELVAQAGRLFDLRITGWERVPHDLCAAGGVPQMTAVEMLTVLLSPYNLTWEWQENCTSVRLVPAPARPVISQLRSVPSGGSIAAWIAQAEKIAPQARFLIRDGKVQVTGTVEEWERLDSPQKGISHPPPLKPERKPAVELSRRRFTLKVDEVPLSALLKTLSQPGGAGVLLEYDAAVLKRAGINLEQRISVNVREVPLQTLLQQALRPVGLEYEIQDQAVRLFPVGVPRGSR